MIDRNRFLDALAAARTDEVVVYTMSPCNHWPDASPSPFNLFVGGAMGYASSVGLGIALASPGRRVVVLDGDGSLLMNLGTLVTIAHHRPANLVQVVLENGMYELTGRVPVPGGEATSFAGLARAAGIAAVAELDDPAQVARELPALLSRPGPTFAVVKVAPGAREPMKASDTLRRAPELTRELAELMSTARTS